MLYIFNLVVWRGSPRYPPQREGNSLSHFTLPAGWNPLSVQQAKRTDIRMLRKEFAIHMNVNYGNGKRGK